MRRKTLEPGEDSKMSLVEHLTDLRKCILKSLLGWLIGGIIVFYFVEEIYHYLTIPFGVTGLVFIAPAEGFLTYLRICIYGGVILASPIILYQFFRFILPGLYKKEKKVIFLLLPGAFALMIGGMVFGYYVLLPFGLKYLLNFGSLQIQPMLSVQKYISFVSNIMIILALIFQLPLIIIGLTKLGIITPGFLRKNRKYAIVISVVIGAILTPPDVITQLMMSGPLLLLYEISIWLSYIFSRKKKKKGSITKDV